MLFLDQPSLDADIYFSTWNETNTVNPVGGKNKSNKVDSPVYIPVTEEQIKQDVGLPITCAVHTKKKYSDFPIIVDGWFLGFDLIKQSGKTYDYVLLMRPDLFFDNSLTVRNRTKAYLLSETFHMYAASIGVRMPPKPPAGQANNPDYLLIDDTILFSTYENMSKFLSYDFKIFLKENEKKFNWHQLLYQYIVIKHKLRVTPLPFKTDNIIARFPVDENTTFQIAEKQWWAWFRENN